MLEVDDVVCVGLVTARATLLARLLFTAFDATLSECSNSPARYISRTVCEYASVSRWFSRCSTVSSILRTIRAIRKFCAAAPIDR